LYRTMEPGNFRADWAAWKRHSINFDLLPLLNNTVGVRSYY
jgi:hypothetical protein